MLIHSADENYQGSSRRERTSREKRVASTRRALRINRNFHLAGFKPRIVRGYHKNETAVDNLRCIWEYG